MHAELVRDALYGRLGDLGSSVHGMAVLFALDRRAAAAGLRAALAEHDVVLVDRYVASNAAYGAARLHQDAAGEFVAWVRDAGDRPVRRAGARTTSCCSRCRARWPPTRAAHRERTEAGRARDAFESDDGLQQRTEAVYAQLAASSWLAPWTGSTAAADPAALAAGLPADRPLGRPAGPTRGR